jgi:hypothetical protein
MTAPDSVPLHALAEDNLAVASPDLLRAMVKTFTDALMSAEADALCNAEYGQSARTESTTATVTARVSRTQERAPSNSPFPSSGPGVTSRTGCWIAAAEPSRPSSPWSPPPTCSA